MKTIFITLTNRAVFRNLFFFKESVFYKLRAKQLLDKDLRIILLIPKREVSKYETLLSSELNDRCLIAPIRVPSPSGKIERLFYFVYSYLIYTGTTKLLATMGMRPDEPPAGGRRFLAPIKWFIANTLGRSEWIKTKLVPALFLKIVTPRPFEEIFEKYKPVLVFASHMYGWFDAHLLAEAKRAGIRTMGMAAGWDHLDKYFLPFHLDTLLAQSVEIKNSAVKYQGYVPSAIEITGYPHFDFITDPRILQSKEDVLDFLHLPKNARYMMYVSGSAYCPDEPAIIAKIIGWIKAGKFGLDMYLIIRPYSGGRSKDKEFDQEKFDRFVEDPCVRFFSDDLWGDVEMSKKFTNVTRYCEVLIGMYTTIILEAATLDRPLVAAAFDGDRRLPLHRSIRRFEQFEHFRDVLKTGALSTAYNFDELQAIIKAYVDNPSLRSGERQVMRDSLCHVLDGKASERIADMIVSAKYISE